MRICQTTTPEAKNMNINEQAALITGGASGLGLATAEALVAAGAKVTLLDMNEAKLKAESARLG